MFQLSGKDLNIRMVNDAATKLYGLSSEDLIGRSIYSFNKKENSHFENQTSKRFIQLNGLGNEIIVDIMLNQLDSDNNEYIALVENKTEEILFEKKKFEIINQAEESEKKKIARELHDGVGQQLVLLNLLFQNLNPNEHQVLKLTEINSLIQNTISEVKEIAYNLLPPELEKGFINAIERFANRINSLGELTFELEINPEINEKELGDVDRFNLYRIVQESINNALKHSKAKKIIFRMKRVNGIIYIEIEDNGIGFDIKKVNLGLGMQNIQHRLKMSNIKGDVSSQVGKGSKIILWF